MRLRKQDFSKRINSNLEIEFAPQSISSYSGLELIKRYFRLIGLNRQIRQAFEGHSVSGDYSVVQMIMVLFALWLTGSRRLKHVAWIAQDPLVKRLSELLTLPSDRTISRWLGQFTNDSLQALIRLNSEIVCQKLRELNFARITLDFDGTVLSCGSKVKWAGRGYNPQNRHSKSLYPLLCHVAQTGQFLKVFNRPGDVHDSKRALEMVKRSVEEIRTYLPWAIIEVRMDSAFFQKDVLNYLSKNKIEFCMKVPLWSWLSLKELMQYRERWRPATKTLNFFTDKIDIAQWNLSLAMTFYRQKLSDTPKVNHQYDLFTPDDGVYEHFVLVSNKNLSAENLLHFYNGRCNMEHNIAEIKGEFGFDVIPCRDYQGNAAHQLISTLCHDVMRNFQIDVLAPKKREKTKTRTHYLEFLSLKTIRFELIHAAGRLINRSGINVLSLDAVTPRQKLYQKVGERIDQYQNQATKRAA